MLRQKRKEDPLAENTSKMKGHPHPNPVPSGRQAPPESRILFAIRLHRDKEFKSILPRGFDIFLLPARYPVTDVDCPHLKTEMEHESARIPQKNDKWFATCWETQ